MPKIPIVLSHWSKLVENLQASPLQFYGDVEAAVARRLIPDSINSRIDWNERGPLSVKREYLRVTRGEHAIDICGAPFGTGFFFSTWLVDERHSLGMWEIALGVAGLLSLPVLLIYFFGFWIGMFWFLIATPFLTIALVQHLNTYREGWDDFVLLIPYVGPMYEFFVRPATYYKTDTALMFQEAVHAAVIEVIDGMTEGKGIRGLSEFDRKPLMAAVAGK